MVTYGFFYECFSGEMSCGHTLGFVHFGLRWVAQMVATFRGNGIDRYLMETGCSGWEYLEYLVEREEIRMIDVRLSRSIHSRIF